MFQFNMIIIIPSVHPAVAYSLCTPSCCLFLVYTQLLPIPSVHPAVVAIPSVHPAVTYS